MLATVLSTDPVPGVYGAGVSDTLARIDSGGRFTATFLCEGIPGADGIAVSEDGSVLVLSETSGSLYRIGRRGGSEELLSGLDHPEGLAISDEGGILVTEDTARGRALLLHPTGRIQVLAESLLYSEGIVLTPGGEVLVTESSAETGSLPFETRVSSVSSGDVLFESLFLWSLSDMVVDPSGVVYACNETSGLPFVSQSVIRIDPASGSWEVFVRGLSSCEGICASPGTFFPLLVAEEDIGGGEGRVVSVDSSGAVSEVARGFLNIEDVAVDTSGRIFVSEDTSGAVIMLSPVRGR
ncbi:MAG: hypothetical protein AVO35_01150 [Candidatus Aegiribacteria sp. MLS_C]|nr:MAG: hypothetical protein AVO35_01150 [Candidatus Aegiribacteria sp. MLS_C]